MYVPDGERDRHAGEVRDLSGVLLPPPLWSQTGSHRMVPSFSGSLSVALPSSMSPSPDFPPLYFPTPGIFWLNWMDRDLGTYQLAMMSCLFFLTKQNKTKTLDNGVWLIYITKRQGITRDGRAVLDGKRTARGQLVHPPIPCILFLGGRSVL